MKVCKKHDFSNEITSIVLLEEFNMVDYECKIYILTDLLTVRYEKYICTILYRLKKKNIITFHSFS